MKVGFARVSTVEQDLSIQLTQLNEYGCEKFFMVNTQVFRLKMMSNLKNSSTLFVKLTKLLLLALIALGDH